MPRYHMLQLTVGLLVSGVDETSFGNRPMWMPTDSAENWPVSDASETILAKTDSA